MYAKLTQETLSMPSRITSLLFLLMPLPAFAQETSFRADTTLVLVPVAVTDKTNRYVLGLEKENFQIFEDNAQQIIKYFSSEDAPLSVGLIVDVSGSIGSKLNTSRQAVSEFLKTLNTTDEAFLVECSDQAQLAVRFTRDAAEIDNKLKTVTSGGLTALLDAVRLGIDQMKEAKNPRKALLVISDGGDNNSRYTSQQVEDLVREADVQIFAMGVFEPLTFGLTASELSGPRVLSEISEQTGGRALAATGSQDLPSIASRIGLELRNQYVLAYSPANENRDGKYRHVQVKLLAPQTLPELKARWRLGYYAPAK
jgi:Ca-activated chloride channel family protein